MTMAIPPDHRKLCAVSDIPERAAKGFTTASGHIFAVKQQGKVYLYQNKCPHLGTPLEWVEDQFLDSSGSMIQCVNHGALFVIETGKCVAGPCAGRSLRPVEYLIEGGELFIFES